jgi:hypothetical protein
MYRSPEMLRQRMQAKYLPARRRACTGHKLTNTESIAIGKPTSSEIDKTFLSRGFSDAEFQTEVWVQASTPRIRC